ncbi:SET domain-containing protein [Leucogyrophana mollusca]|uniref:SET domain-containing protein n=1 Tax=Leucogyrophana mollusca TaxID=85980 RepID=A0ACB8BT66_9AGAM|nr:SET domain-containing protein [Leucogyrophana mollusca]
MSRNIVPGEDELKSILVGLKTANPSAGVAKIHGLVLAANPTWQVSEKRVRKFLRNEGLVVSAPGSREIHPSSRLNEALRIEKWSGKVEVKYFNASKGKGLIAKEKLLEGDIIWKEDPFILAPEWNIYDLQTSGRACAFCSTIFREFSSLNIACPASKEGSPCPARFCTRLCLGQSGKTHPLLCPSQNPASVPLLSFARRAEWMALHALAQCTSRLLLAHQKDAEVQLANDLGVVRGLAELGMEERFQSLRFGVEPDRDNWRKAFELYLQAFKEPSHALNQKKLARILKLQLPPDMAKELFEYDAFLRGLGRMSLSWYIEAHGGLYALHSHLNHSCVPNVSVRHLDQRSALARVTLIAKKDIEAGEELLVTYTDPSGSLKARRKRLSEWGFGPCQCERCLVEERAAKESGAQDQEADDLADQLKAGLGVM